MDVPEAGHLHDCIVKGLRIFGQDSAALDALKAIGNAGSHENALLIKTLNKPVSPSN